MTDANEMKLFKENYIQSDGSISSMTSAIKRVLSDPMRTFENGTLKGIDFKSYEHINTTYIECAPNILEVKTIFKCTDHENKVDTYEAEAKILIEGYTIGNTFKPYVKELVIKNSKDKILGGVEPRTNKANAIVILGIIVVSILFFVFLFSNNSENDEPGQHSYATDAWFNGGNLHTATVAQWKSASYKNKLATAGDYLSATLWKNSLNSTNDFEKLKIKANELVSGIDYVITAQGTDDIKINEIAGTIIATSGNDLGP
jgi:hypothetical protein